MSTWVKILTEDDEVNLANSNLTQTAAENRTYTTASSTLLTLQTSTSDSAFIRLEDYGDATDTITFQGNTGRVKFKGANDAISGSLSLKQCDDNGNNLVTLAAPLTLASSYTLTLPQNDGDADQVLKTDGSGTLSWVDQSGGSVDGSGSSGKVALWQDGNTLTFDTGISYSGSNDSLTVGALTSTSAGSGNGSVTAVVGNVGHLTVAAVLSPNGSTDGAFGTGTRMFEKLPVTAGMEAGRVYYLRSGAWTKADKDDTNSVNILAVATDAENSGLEMIAEGFVRMEVGNGFSLAQSGTPVYIGDDGNVTTSAPTGSGDIARVVGYVISASAKTIYFKPDNTWVTVE